jgi:hypothetical protein
MRLGQIKRFGHGGAQGCRGRFNRRGLADIDEWLIVGERHAVKPATGLHHRWGECGLGA